MDRSLRVRALSEDADTRQPEEERAPAPATISRFVVEIHSLFPTILGFSRPTAVDGMTQAARSIEITHNASIRSKIAISLDLVPRSMDAMGTSPWTATTAPTRSASTTASLTRSSSMPMTALDDAPRALGLLATARRTTLGRASAAAPARAPPPLPARYFDTN